MNAASVLAASKIGRIIGPKEMRVSGDNLSSKMLVDRLIDFSRRYSTDGRVPETLEEAAREIERLQQRVAELERQDEVHWKTRRSLLRRIEQRAGAKELPKPINYDLWRHLHEEHGLTLLQSELDEIVRLAVPPSAGYSVPSDAMDQIYETLKFYANLCSYGGERIGGVLAGCPRGPAPTPSDLVVNAQKALWLIDRDVLGRAPPTKSAPWCSLCEGEHEQCDLQEWTRKTQEVQRLARHLTDEKPGLPHRLDMLGDCKDCTYPSLNNMDPNNCTAVEKTAQQDDLCAVCRIPLPPLAEWSMPACPACTRKADETDAVKHCRCGRLEWELGAVRIACGDGSIHYTSYECIPAKSEGESL